MRTMKSINIVLESTISMITPTKLKKKFDFFLIFQVLLFSSIHFSWSLVTPLIYKLQGLYWTTILISVVCILNRISSIFTPLFKEMKLGDLYKLIICLDFIYLASINLYFYNTELFLYIECGLGIIYSILLSAFYINYKAYIAEKYSINTLKEYEYTYTVYTGIFCTLGYLFVILIEYLLPHLIIVIFDIMLFMVIIFQLYNHKKYYSKMK
jgi:hypothetical protein